MKQPYYFLMLALSLTGCSTMSGYDGSSNFSCKAPDGVSCSSLSGVYANANQNNLPGLQEATENKKNNKENTSADKANPSVLQAGLHTGVIGEPLNSGDSIYTPSEVLRVWIAPWQDEDGDLHDQSYIYMVANYGRWAIEHNQHRIMNEYQPTNLTTGAVAMDKQAPNQTKPVTAGGHNQNHINPVLPEGSYSRSSPTPTENIDDLEDSF